MPKTRDLFKKPRRGENDIVVSGPRGGRVANVATTQAVTTANELKPPTQQGDFFKSEGWSNHFLSYVASRNNPDSKATPGAVKLFQEFQNEFPLTQSITREKALAFVNGTLTDLSGDKEVKVMIEGYSGNFSLETMKALLVNDEEFEKKHGGRWLMEQLGTKTGYHINSEYSAYRDWLNTEEGIRSPKPLPDKPVQKFPGMTVPQKSLDTVERVRTKARDDSEANKQKALEKLISAGIAPEQAEETLIRMREFIGGAPITINFNPTHKEISLYESYGGRTPIWAAPKSVVDGQNPGYCTKRQEVEQQFFGIEGNPHDAPDPLAYDTWSDRPVYGCANLGSLVTGAADQWGKCYFVLKEDVKERVTYSQRDTFNDDKVHHIGTPEHLDGVISDMPIDKLKKLNSYMTGEEGVRSLGETNYIESHIHGPISWKRDIEKMVIDRSQVPEGSALKQQLMRFARDNNIQVETYSYKQWEDIAMESSVKTANEQVKTQPLDPHSVPVQIPVIPPSPPKVIPVPPELDRRLRRLEKRLDELDKDVSWEKIKSQFKGGREKAREEVIEKIDRTKMAILETVDPAMFATLQQRNQNSMESLKTFKPELQPDGTFKFQPLNKAFVRFAQRERCAQNLDFLAQLKSFKDDLRKGEDLGEMKVRAWGFYTHYLENHDYQRLNTEGDAREKVTEKIQDLESMSQQQLDELFDPVQKEVMDHLQQEILPRFQETEEYTEALAGKFDEYKEATKDELKRIEKLERKIANLEKPRSWERFKAISHGGTKKVTDEVKNEKANLETEITQKTSPDFLGKYQEQKKLIDEAVQKELNAARTKKALELQDTLDELGVGGNIKEKPKAPKRQTEPTLAPNSGPLNLEDALANPEMKEALQKFTQKEMSSENLDFYLAVEAFKRDVESGLVSIEQLEETARDLNARFVVNGGPEAVTLDNEPAQARVADAIAHFDNMTSREELGQLFEEVQGETKRMLEDTIRKFQTTPECKELQSRIGQDDSSENVRNKMGYKKPKVGNLPNKNNLQV